MQSKLIVSPLNYIGGKYRLLDKILPYFPKDINTFVDLFCGGCNIAINIDAKKIICIDNQKILINLYENFKNNTEKYCFEKINDTIKKYNLSKYNKEAYYKIRNDFNKGNREWFIFYSMLIHSFNYQIRFNKKGEYNNSSGYGKSCFNKNLQNKLINFIRTLKIKDIMFKTKDFRQLSLRQLSINDFIYIDPPYYNTDTVYNKFWTNQEEQALYILINELNINNIKFALSNIDTNNSLLNFCSKQNFNIYNLNFNYNHCCYNKKNKNINEILITNY